MALENTPEPLPLLLIEIAILGQTIGRRVGHEESMVRVIMREKTLATKREQSVELAEPSTQ